MMDFRIGHGYDAHQLVEGRRLVLGGVKVPHTLGLLGHSDADVLLHAVMDAIIGALALGDIGCLFPDSDQTYKDADSLRLLGKVRLVMEEMGWQIGNIDATVVAQEPKLKPYVSKMRENIAVACAIARALGISADQVNVKATTEEEMGFTGAEEGICAHAVCLLERVGDRLDG